LGDKPTHNRQFDELKEVLRKHYESTRAHFDSRFQQHEKTVAKTAYDKAFLESLWYPDIRAREEGIKDAHAKTFKWLLDDSEIAVQPWDNFVAWLEGGQGTYWVSGKAGSGKSTLMRYICDNDRTTKLLQAWAGPREISIVKFFFWRAGSSVQKTIVGLLRSLLYQIFSALPELIGTISTDNVASASQYEALPAWTEARLKKYLGALLSVLAKSHRVCFFLDGLDELEQSYEQILSVVRNLIENSEVKICLSSRPYRVFSDAFSSSAMLKLHDLTNADILTYVSESLLPRDSIPISEDSGSAFNISETIVGRADGVFLWAELVVKEVNRGITNEDSQQQLKHRLDSLPDEIEQLYSYMLRSIDIVYRKEAARCFAVTMMTKLRTLLQLSLMVHEADRNNQSLAFADLSASQTLDLCNSTARRLPTTCAGLLEIQEKRRIFGVIADHNLLSAVARLIVPSQFATPVTAPDRIPQAMLELLRIHLCTSIEPVHRTAFDFLQENSVGIKFMKDHNRYAVDDSVSCLNNIVATWRLLGCIDPWHYVTESIREEKFRKRGVHFHDQAIQLPGFCDLLRYRNGNMDSLLRHAVITESNTATAQSALWDYVERAMTITKSQYLTKLKGGPCLQIPHNSCVIEAASREHRCDETPVTLGLKIEHSPQTADPNPIRADNIAPVVISSMPEDFLGFAAFYGLSLYVQYRLDSEPGLQSGEKITYLLACFISNIDRSLHKLPDERVDVHRSLKFVRGLLDRGADPNAVTASSTIWGDFLEQLYTAYHCSRIFNKAYFRSVWASMVIAFLAKGAKTAQILDFRSGALWTFDLTTLSGGGKLSPNFRNCLSPDFRSCLFGFNRSISILTILHQCLRDCDEWVFISNKLIAPHKEHFSKCTRFYFADPGPERWGPFVGYPLSDQQSEDFLRVFEPCTDGLEAPGSLDKLKLVDQVLRLRRELEEGAFGVGTKFGEFDRHYSSEALRLGTDSCLLCADEKQ